jgi:transposase-like protein
VAGRSTYSDEDKAAVLAVLAANGGNIKRTARETSIPVSTLSYWAKGNASPSTEAVQAAVDKFVDQAERVRNMALDELERAIGTGEVKDKDLITILGVLDDKITRARGLPTQRTEHQHSLPSRDELEIVLGGAIRGMVAAAEQRDDEIIEDAEYTVVPPRALPKPREQA